MPKNESIYGNGAIFPEKLKYGRKVIIITIIL